MHWLSASHSNSRLSLIGSVGAGVLCIALLLSSPFICSAANEAQELLNAAQASYNEGDYEQAKALYQQVIDRFPDREHAGYVLLGLDDVHISVPAGTWTPDE